MSKASSLVVCCDVHLIIYYAEDLAVPFCRVRLSALLTSMWGYGRQHRIKRPTTKQIGRLSSGEAVREDALPGDLGPVSWHAGASARPHVFYRQEDLH